ncbi:hypothetical protein ABLV17_07595 [Klebsiella sp. CN_Kp091]|uniref:hypothetical protein n=1 Tax=unclassified Klebsiella TaxID=2608929 RepID=UPI0032B5A5B4
MATPLPTPTQNPVPSTDIRDAVYAGAMMDLIVSSTAKMYTDRLGIERYTIEGIRQNLIPLGRQYMTLADAQADIANIPDGSTTYYRSPDDSALAIEVINNAGMLYATGRRMPSQAFVAGIDQFTAELSAQIASLQLKTAMLSQYSSDEWQWILTGLQGPSATALALDNDFGLWLAGLKSSVQDYVEQLIPKQQANLYQGLQHVIVAQNGVDGLLTINDNGDIRIVGTDDVLQDRLNALCSTNFSRTIIGFQHVVFAADLKTAIFAIDDDGGVHIPGIDGPLQDNLGESLATIKTVGGVPAAAWRGEVVWSERPVLTTQKLTPSGFVFSYLPGGEAVSGSGVMYVPSIREMPLDAPEIQGGGSSGQSLNMEADHVGQNIVNRNPIYRGRLLAGMNGRPEGKNIQAVNEDDVSTLNDMNYPSYRQGNILPMYDVLMDKGVGNTIFIHAPFAAGGRSFKQISKGTIPYQNGQKFVQMGKDAADGVGKPYTFRFLTFEHGETDSDNGDNLLPGDYLTKANTYFSGLQSDFKAISGQTTDFAVIIGQVGSRFYTRSQPVDEAGNAQGDPVIVQPYSIPAVDQLTYVRQNPDTAIMYGPKYPLNWLYSDGSLSHINAKGKVLQGEYTAQAIYWHLYDTEKKGTWTGCKIRDITLTGNLLELACDVPFPPLIIDTDFIANCPNYGISLEKNSATVQAVSVINGNTIHVELNQPPAPDDVLLIGFTNTTPHTNGNLYPLSCFRDSSQTVSRWVTLNGAPFPLYNWLCLDRLPLTGEM